MSSANSSERSEKLVLRVEVGHESWLLSEPTTVFSGQHTHKWTIFVRGLNDSQLDGQLVNRVIFKLHDDFPNPKRVISKAPFEVTETGYGGFTVPICVIFHHSKLEHNIEYDMTLKYNQYDKNKEVKLLEFKDPKPDLRAKLLKAGAEVNTNKLTKSHSSSFQDVFGETLHRAAPTAANDKIKQFPIAVKTKLSPMHISNSKSKNGSSVVKTEPREPSLSSQAPLTGSAKKRKKSRDELINSDGRSPGGTNKIGLDASSVKCTIDAVIEAHSVSKQGKSCIDTPSTSGDSTEERRNRNGDRSEQKPKKKPKISGEGSKVSNATLRVSPDESRDEGKNKSKRKKTKSDSGLDSDYSGGAPNAHSPSVVNGAVNGHSSSLFSPPDSAHSPDHPIQESPVSSSSISSTICTVVANEQLKLREDLNAFSYSETISTVASTSAAPSSDSERLRALLALQRKIMTIRDGHTAQNVADIVAEHASYQVTTDCLEFDLCSFNWDLVQRLLTYFDSAT